MARPQKTGLQYFPLDVDIFDDDKVLPVSVKFGATGEAIVVRILCLIYREGYYVKWNDGLKFKVANQAKVDEPLVEAVVETLVKYRFFDEKTFREDRVLTSEGIQKRWSEATKKRVVEAGGDYWVLENEGSFRAGNPSFGGRNPGFRTRNNGMSEKGEKGVSAPETPVSVEETPVSAPETPVFQPESTQKKLNKIKLKKPSIIVPLEENSWKHDFLVYQATLKEAYDSLRSDEPWLKKQGRLNPRVDVLLTLEKAYENYWNTEAGWAKKKKARIVSIDWKATFTNALSLPANRVWLESAFKQNGSYQTGDGQNKGDNIPAY